VKKIISLIIFGLAVIPIQPIFASGMSLGSLSHIHQVRISGKTILLGTHEGLFILKNNKTVVRVGNENFDVMGLSIDGNRFYASGHPGPDSKLLNPVGLLNSTNGGKSWQKISLEGKVDFHLLESQGPELYGADSQSGDLLYSHNYGKDWSSLGKNAFSDIAISPLQKSSALALREGKLISTKKSFLSKNIIAPELSFSQIEWTKKSLLAASERKLLYSLDQGKTWKVRFSFDRNITGLAQSPQLIVAITGSKLWKSTDQGKTFSLFE
jgi:photosystem II stability/assembly factor-like uncharacterized protein